MSRCIAARSRGILAPITSRAAPALNRFLARMLVALAVLRSLLPTSTTPSPTGMMSPPSSRRRAPVVVGAAEPELEAGVAEPRVEAVDRLDVQRLELARRPVHRVQRHAAVDPRARVPREQVVRQRRQDEVGRRQRAADHGADLVRQLRGGDAAGQPRGELVGRHLAHPRRQLVGEHRRDLFRPQPLGQQPGARLGVLERLASSSWNSSTSTPYSRIRSTNASNSWRARRTQITSSNSSSWQFDGDRRSCARSGPVHHHGAERPDLGVRTELGGGVGFHALTPLETQPMAAATPMNTQQMTKTATRNGHTKRR